KLDYYEKTLLEKDEQLKAALEEVELLKQKNNQKSNKQQK
ncbi:MAG TPA: transposase, partial [Fervidobacterium sp.]|nr:transposase [Fervidobacterium sp.]